MHLLLVLIVITVFVTITILCLIDIFKNEFSEAMIGVAVFTPVTIIFILWLILSLSCDWKTKEYKELKCFMVENAQYIKYGEKFINVNKQFGKSYKDGDDFVVLDRQREYMGISYFMPMDDSYIVKEGKYNETKKKLCK